MGVERKKTKFSGFFDLVNALEGVILIFSVTAMVLTVVLQIIGRMIGHPFPWTEETSRYLFLWMMFVALAAGFNRCESSRVTLLLQIGPNWLKKLSEVIYFIVVEGFFLFMFLFGFQVVRQQVVMHEMGTALLIPMFWIGICQPFGALLGFIGTIQSFLEYHSEVAVGERTAEKS